MSDTTHNNTQHSDLKIHAHAGDTEHSGDVHSNDPQIDNVPNFYHEEEANQSLELSSYTNAVIQAWIDDLKPKHSSVNKISVSQTVSFAAFLYEKIRNAVEFREEHLIRRSAIERILKRKLILNDNGREIAEPLIKELLWARYYENNTIGEDKIGEIQSVIDKYFYLRNEMSKGRPMNEQEKIWNFIVEVTSCEIEDRLSPDHKREAFTNYVFQMYRRNISLYDNQDELERDIQVYIAVEKAFARSDLAYIRYHLLQLMLPEVRDITWKNADQVQGKMYEAFSKIEQDLKHPLALKVRNSVKKQLAPFYILRDLFEKYSLKIKDILIDTKTLKIKVDEACRIRYEESKIKLRRTAVRSFIYILLTKVIFALLLEIPYDIYVLKEISYFPIIINVIFPPLFMMFIILTVTVPGDDNTKRVYSLIKNIITTDPSKTGNNPVIISKKSKQRGVVFSTLFYLLYLLTYLVTFGGIIYILSAFNFSAVSQSIFIFFLTLVTFFAFRVIQITQVYQVVESEGIFSPVFDFAFLPIIRVGQWLSGEVLQKFNFFIFIFDFIVEMPFKAIVEVFDEWVRFVKAKKDEII